MLKPFRKTMVCVTVQKTCERLIREGAALAGDAGLSVVHVAKNGAALLGGGDDGEALEYLFRIAREYGADMDMLRSTDVIETIVDFATKNGIAQIVLGEGRHDFIEGIRWRLPNVAVTVVK